jgi:hypothetical protein
MAKKSNATNMAQKGDWADNKAPSEVYAGEGSNVVKEAKARKRGGKAMKEVGKASGAKMAKRADRMARKSGGICSSDWSAASGPGQKPKGHSTNE